MFFYLSKLLLFVIKPMVWVLLFLFSAWFTKEDAKRKRRLIKGLLILFLFSNGVIVNELVLLYESEGTKDLKPRYDYAIVLGGFSKMDSSLNRPVFYEANDRLMQALSLYHQGKVGKLIISSGSGSLLKQDEKEADAIALYLKNINIPDSAIIVENKSRNTSENIEFSSVILDSLKVNSTVLVISSAWHLPRVKLCEENRSFDYFATNYIADRKRDYSIDAYIVPSVKAMMIMELMIKEWVGYVTYAIKH
jgi:uncharacterized SAM-binding protein YcdF (DUF218 family)